MEDKSQNIPDKSRSLRKTSVTKRLELEVKRKLPKIKEKRSKKKLLSKYRRKSANAQERARMKKQSDVFEVLKEIVPTEKLMKSDDDKETKVTTLRAAILYINSLKSLLEDCEAGRLDSKMLHDCALTSSSGVEVHVKKKNPAQKKVAAKRKLTIKKGDKVHPKWINYSKQYLQTKFGKTAVDEIIDTPISLPTSSLPPYEYPRPLLPSIPLTHHITTSLSSTATTTTYLCQTPKTFVTPILQQSTTDSCSLPTTYIYSSTPSTHPDYYLTTTNSMVTSYSHSPRPCFSSRSPSPTSASPGPSSPRDVNEISLHIELIGSQGADY